ncbi:hypothetical protein PoB_001710900 [Plakobranchus ocellatus]|uniref:Uncharacterized protein n=1 Tax=Plakobranchus ocellatus TaxID=259542 RepID=A0AAV3Z864_9GAST|nr:hypothetical protein PoB_001710900 [Plakobranchus ocellatus]
MEGKKQAGESSGSSGKADGYQVRGSRFESQSGHSQSSIAPLYPPNTSWVARSLKTRLKKRWRVKQRTEEDSSSEVDLSLNVLRVRGNDKDSLLLLQGTWGRVPADCRIWSTASTVVDRAEKNAQEIGQEGHEEGMPIGRTLYKSDVDPIVQSDNGEGNRVHQEDEINKSANTEPSQSWTVTIARRLPKDQYS